MIDLVEWDTNGRKTARPRREQTVDQHQGRSTHVTLFETLTLPTGISTIVMTSPTSLVHACSPIPPDDRTRTRTWSKSLGQSFG